MFQRTLFQLVRLSLARHSCYLNDVNAFVYLTALEEHAQQVRENPELWLPWSYHKQLDGQDEDDE